MVLAAIAVLGGAGALLAGQLRALSLELPTYQSNIQLKLRDLRDRLKAPGPLDGVLQTIDGIQSDEASPPATAPAGQRTPSPPQRVQIEEKPMSPLRQALALLGAAGGPLADAGLVLVFVVLLLFDRQDLRDRLLRLLGGSLHRTTDALDEAGRRISKYLMMQLLVNLSYGVPMAAGLWLIGVPGAVLWGAVAAVLRFVPYLGPLVSAVFPLALAFAVDPGWSMVLMTLGLILVLELVSNNVVEPWAYGASTGLSAMSLMVAATFWTALWGPIGLVMSTPLTVCLLVLGRHVPQLAFLDVLLGGQPALDEPTRFYQRLLADDVDGAVELATERVDVPDAGGVAGFYHHVGVPALRLASGDHAQVASAEHRHRLVSGTDRVIDELRAQYPPPAAGAALRVVCIGGKWEADRLASRMLVHALALSGVSAEHHAGGLGGTEAVAKLDLQGAQMVCLSFFSPQPQTSARQLCRRLRRRWPDLQIVLALWNAPPDCLAEDWAHAMGVQAVATSVDETVMRVTHLLGEQLSADYLRAPVPPTDVDRVRALRASGCLGEAARALFDRAARRAADVFDVPLAMVSLIDESRQQVGGAGGALPNLDEMRSALAMPRELSVCGHVVASGKTLVVEDLARDPRFATNPALRSRGLRF